MACTYTTFAFETKTNVMRQTIKTTLIALVALAAVSTIAGCKKDKKAPGRTFSIEKFKANLKTQMGTSIRGYSVVIGKSGQFADSIQYGTAVFNPTGGNNTPMTMHTYMNIASVTKTLTAIAAIKLLGEKGISLDSTIGKYLPTYWSVNANVASITFKELLSHSSGLRETSTTYDSLKAQCARGLDGAKTRSYANSNFALFRVLLPYVNDWTNLKSAEGPWIANNGISNYEQWLSQQYLTLMQQYVFTPSGITNATCNDAAISGTQTNMFSEGPVMNIITTAGNWTETSGGGGYYMTAFQVAQVVAYLAHSTTLLSAAQLKSMDDNLYGCDPEDSPTITAGKAYGKDGALIWSNVITPNAPGLQTYICRYPNGVEVVIFANSILNDSFTSLGGRALTAYEASWE